MGSFHECTYVGSRIPKAYNIFQLFYCFISCHFWTMNLSAVDFIPVSSQIGFSFFVLHAWLKLIIEKKVSWLNSCWAKTFLFFTTLCRTLCSVLDFFFAAAPFYLIIIPLESSSKTKATRQERGNEIRTQCRIK